MAEEGRLAVQEKKETPSKEEKTIPARYFTPNTDIYETGDDLTVIMEIPGVEKKDVNIGVENDFFISTLRSTSRNMRALSRSMPNTTSVIIGARSRSPIRSTRTALAPN